MGLLRCSRSASQLSKKASVTRKALGLAGRATHRTLGGLGGFVQRHPYFSLGTVGGVGAGSVAAAGDIRRGLQGMSPEYLAARRAARDQGYHVPSAPGRFRGRTELAKELMEHSRRLRTIGSDW